MRRLLTLAALCASLASLLPAQNIPLSEYRTRREALRKNLDGTVKQEKVLPVRFVPMTGEAERQQ